VTSGSFTRHDSWSGVAPWAGRIDEPAPVRALADGAGEASQLAVRLDPLIHPVAITGHCVIGDQIRVPAARCAMAGCEAAFADPAALGEADNRVRAVTAGWAKDALCRLVCPACQRDRPAPPWWVPFRQPSTPGDHRPASGTSQPTGATGQSAGSAAAGGPPAAAAGDHRPASGTSQPTGATAQSAGSAAAGGPPAAAEDLHHRRQWPRLLSALGRQGQASHAARSAGRRA
jgi:hypothetical protein